MPLFTLVIAHFALHDEPLTLSRVAGLGAGFAGVAVLVGRGLGNGAGDAGARVAARAADAADGVGGRGLAGAARIVLTGG